MLSGELVALLFVHCLDDPLESFFEAFFGFARAGEDGPLSVGDVSEAELIDDVFGVEGELQIALVGEDEQRDASELLVLEEVDQLRAGLEQSAVVRRVDDVDERLGVLEVVAPVLAEDLLAWVSEAYLRRL